MNNKTVNASKALMKKQTKINGAPNWELTEIAIKKGRELTKKYSVDENLVIASLYLAHVVFDKIPDGKIQKRHEILSAKYVKPYLIKWKVNPKEQKIIINTIESHHGKKPMKSKVVEIMRNAEGFKFITLRGSKIYLRELKNRGYDDKTARKMVINKMKSKIHLLTLPECKKEAKRNSQIIIKNIWKD